LNRADKITVTTLARMKSAGEKIVALTAYDFSSAVAAGRAGVEVLLVGDSLGMVVQGHDSSLPVTIDDTAYHVRCVRRAKQGALLMADLPFMSYYSESRSLENAAILMREGAQMVKLEGGAWLAETRGARHRRPDFGVARRARLVSGPAREVRQGLPQRPGRRGAGRAGGLCPSGQKRRLPRPRTRLFLSRARPRMARRRRSIRRPP